MAVTTSAAATDVATSATRLHERAFIALVGALALILSSLPILAGHLFATPERQFAGIVYNMPDHAQYFAWMRDLARAPLAPNRLTPEPNAPAFFNLLWWTVGRIGALTGLEYAALWSGLRIVAAVAVLAAGYAFLNLAVADVRQRRLAYLLFVFGGGLGFIWVIVKYIYRLPEAPFPFNIYTAEANTFWILTAFPHFGMALALIVGMMALLLQALRTGRYRYAVACGVLGAILGLQHAYDLITIYAVMGLFGVLVWVRDRRFPAFLFRCGIIIFALSAPAAAYLSALVLLDPTWGKKLSQFDNAGAWTPPPWELPILLGVPFLLALINVRPRALQSRNDGELLVVVWFLSHFVLAYLPVKFQIHLLLGWQMPIAVLAAAAVFTRVAPWLQRRRPALLRPTLALLAVLAVATNVYLVAWRFVDFRRLEAPYYLTHGEVESLAWLEAHVTADDVVLADLEYGQHVPVRTDARAFLAHWAGTLDFHRKRAMVRDVFDPTVSDARRREILAEYRVTYLVVRERDNADEALSAAVGRYLTLAFSSGDTTVYRVTATHLPNG
jgi:hypothetical protein